MYIKPDIKMVKTRRQKKDDYSVAGNSRLTFYLNFLCCVFLTPWVQKRNIIPKNEGLHSGFEIQIAKSK